MNVKELKEMLSKYADDMEIVTEYHSDYHTLDEITTIKAVEKHSAGYIMRSHPTMSDENKLNEKEFLCIGGS